jgi:PAS domain S-box-containing protein
MSNIDSSNENQIDPSIDLDAQSRLEAVLASVADAHIVFDRQWHYLYVNEAAARAIGRRPEEILGHTLWELYPDIIGSELERQYRRAMDERVPVTCDFYYARADTWWANRFSPTPDGLAVFATEITERKQAEQGREQAERKYREIFENASEGIFQSVPDGRYVAVNPALARMYGYESPEDLIRSCNDISRQIYVDAARRAEFKRLIERDGFVRGFEFEGYRKDRSKFWISVNARAVRNGSGEISYYEGTAQDITDRKRAQEALRISEEKYKNIFYFAPVGIYQSLRDGTILTANQTLANMLGYDSVGELLKRNLERDVYFDPADRERLRRKFEHNDLAGESEVQWKRKDGAIIWVHIIAHAFKVDGTTQYFDGFARNITEENQARVALAESEERYRELFENSRDAIYVHDMSGRYTSINRAAEELSGFSRDEIVGKHYSNFIAPSYLREARESFCRKLDLPIETTYEAQIICKDSSRKPVEVSSRMIYRNGEPIAVQGTVRDITELKRAQRVMQTYSRRLIQAQEAERESIARELHDEVGQALTAISMNLEWIRRSGAATPAAESRIEESIEVIDDTLRHVRELSLELRPSLLDDLGLAAALGWYAERFSVRTGIATEVNGDILETAGLHRTVQTALFRIVQEALTNAARHSRATKAIITLDQRNGSLEVGVSDNGIGFDAQSLLTGSTGVALGLRGMQERAHAVNANLDIKSRPGGGTQVMVAVPLKITSQVSSHTSARSI